MEAEVCILRLVVISMGRESDYYIWLRNLTGNRSNYRKLIKQLDSIEFTWIFTLDGNRAAGGLNLRRRFAYEASTILEDVRVGPCSVLEMLIGVAVHMEDQLTDTIETWFWTLIENLHLDQFDDSQYDSRGVEYIVSTWLNRNYLPNGEGSIFPLSDYPGDCRNIDIWAQMNAWISENYPTDDSWLY